MMWYIQLFFKNIHSLATIPASANGVHYSTSVSELNHVTSTDMMQSVKGLKMFLQVDLPSYISVMRKTVRTSLLVPGKGREIQAIELLHLSLL